VPKLDAGPKLDTASTQSPPADASPPPSSPGTPVSPTAPSKHFDLSHWKLQIPGPKDIAPSVVTDGYQSKYFYADAAAQTMLFWLDTSESGSTANSSFVRSELREQMTPGKDSTNWGITGTHVMSARLRIKSSTADPDKVTVLQIHGYGDTPPLIKFAIQSGSAYGLIKTDKTGENEDKVLLASGIGRDFFDAEIRIHDRKMTVTVNGQAAVKDRDISFWPYTNYFKAGNYPQAHQGIVVVEFQKLSVTHQ
jgi:hypothetical protein